MAQKRILMVGDPSPYINYLSQIEGTSVILIQAPDRMGMTNIKQLEELHVFDLDDAEKAIALAKALHELKPIDAVWSFTEVGLLTASLVSAALGLPGNTERAVRLTRDKRAMRQVLNEHNISRVEYFVTNQLYEAEQFVAQVGYPIILKPANGYGSMSVFRVENHEQLVEYFTYMVRDLAGHDSILIEEFLDGPEFSVEFMTVEGRHIPLTITDKLTTNVRCVEVGHTMPSQLPSQTQQEIYDLVTQMLALVDHQVGPTHTEIKLTSKGPRIIETHTRPGGDFIAYMLEHAFHIELITLTMEHLLGTPINVRKGREGAAAVRYFQIDPGRVESITGIEDLKNHPNLLWLEFNLNVGDEVKEMVSTFTRYGCFVIQADTLQEVHELADELLKRVQIRTVPNNS